MNEQNVVIVVAAGSGLRSGLDFNKVLADLHGRCALQRCLEALNEHPRLHQIAVVVRPQDRQLIEDLLHEWALAKVMLPAVPGGQERFHSVQSGLAALRALHPTTVLIHDGARPFVRQEYIDGCLDAVARVGAGVVATPVRDTLRQTDTDNLFGTTISRHGVWQVQTPQAFRFEQISQAYTHYDPERDGAITDDAALLEMAGQPVEIVPGSYVNIKLTTPEDLALAQLLARQFDAQRQGSTSGLT